MKSFYDTITLNTCLYLTLNTFPNKMNILNNKWLQIGILALTTIILYGHTLDVPFYLDDHTSVVENSATRSLDLPAMWKYAPLRVIGTLSFAVNYAIHELDPAGYHITNILIHFLAGLAAFFLCQAIIKTPALQQYHTEKYIYWLPFVAAFIFLIHPLQTQAITYIVQRYASLAAAFYLASLASYVWARLKTNQTVKTGLFAASGCFALLALFTKQNALTLPLAILAIEAILFQTRSKKLITSTLITAGAFLGFWLLCSSLLNYDPFSFATLDRVTKATDSISRSDYFINQMPLLWKYITLFFWPVGLHLDYFVPFHQSFTPLITTALFAHLLVLALAAALFRRLPLISFAVFFYYITHLIESGIIPIPDLFFEHRSYLPNLGLCLLSAWTLTVVLPKYLNAEITIGVTIAILFVFGVTTWNRNNTWRSPLKFWEQCAKEDPENYRALGEAGKFLIIDQRYQEAYTFLDRSLKMQQKYRLPFSTNQSVAVNMAFVLQHLKGNDAALAYIDTIVDKDLEPRNLARLLTSKGKILMVQKRMDEAAECFTRALELDKLNNLNYVTMSNLGVIYAMKKDFTEAERLFKESLRLKPGYKSAADNLKNVYIAIEESKN